MAASRSKKRPNGTKKPSRVFRANPTKADAREKYDELIGDALEIIKTAVRLAHEHEFAQQLGFHFQYGADYEVVDTKLGKSYEVQIRRCKSVNIFD